VNSAQSGDVGDAPMRDLARRLSRVAAPRFASLANAVATGAAVRQTSSMAGAAYPPDRIPPARRVLGVLLTVAVAAALAAGATLLRLALTPQLGALSPFMLYVAAVLVAGLARGPLCGALVMLAGGLAGFRLFLSHGGVAAPGAELALMIFWGVSAPVLVTANELRVQLKDAMDRLSAALRRHGPSPR